MQILEAYYEDFAVYRTCRHGLCLLIYLKHMIGPYILPREELITARMCAVAANCLYFWNGELPIDLLVVEISN